MNRVRVPALPQWLLARRVDPSDRPMVLGDLDEQFQAQAEVVGPLRARLWYWREALLLAWGLWWWTPRPSFVRGRVMAMDDVRYAGRRLRKQPLATLETSASMDMSRLSGAVGYWPRMAWLPITMKSRSLAIAAAARRMCSSAARFIEVQDRLSLALREDTGKRTRLAQTSGLRRARAEQGNHLRQGRPIQDGLPLPQCCSGSRIEPPMEVLPGHVEQLGPGLKLRGNRRVQGQAPIINPLMGPHRQSIALHGTG
jgi:hypothetical protein